MLLAFGEPVTPAVAAGIALVSGGVMLVGLGRQVSRRALGWAGATGASIALYTVLDAQGVRAAPSAGSYIAWVYLTLGGGIGLLFAPASGQETRGRILAWAGNSVKDILGMGDDT